MEIFRTWNKMILKNIHKKYLLINKAIFFPKTGILAFGDLHLGYEQMLKNQGMSLRFNQLEQSINDVKEILAYLKKEKLKLKKIIIVGDLKHHFHFELREKFEIRDFLEFLESLVGRKNIILIKGNHEKIELDSRKYRDYFITGDIIFSHGDKLFPKILDKKIKTIVLGHVHPAIILKDKQKIKKEKYKCFLIGKYKKKEIIILPSFLNLVEGVDIDREYKNFDKFFFISKTQLKKFRIYAIGENKIYYFGKLKDLK